MSQVETFVLSFPRWKPITIFMSPSPYFKSAYLFSFTHFLFATAKYLVQDFWESIFFWNGNCLICIMTYFLSPSISNTKRLFFGLTTAQIFHRSRRKCKVSPKMERPIQKYQFKRCTLSVDSISLRKKDKIGEHWKCQALSWSTWKTSVQSGETRKKTKFRGLWDRNGGREDSSCSFWRKSTDRKFWSSWQNPSVWNIFPKGGGIGIENHKEGSPEAKLKEWQRAKEGNNRLCHS